MLEERLNRMEMRKILVSFLAIAVISATQSHALLKVPPLMVKQPNPNDELLFQVASGQAENDKPFVIECEANAEPAPRYTWTKNGVPFDWQIYDERISQQPGRGTLVITQPKEEDLGQYKCFAQNELGIATSNSVFVRKSVLNSFKNEDPKTISVKEGQPASLHCQPPDGYPKPLVHWMIQDDKGSLRSINSTRLTVDPEGTLWFSNVTRRDQSYDFTYACSATSTFRNEYKLGSKVFLRVDEMGGSSAQIKNQPLKQFISRRNTVILKGRELRLWCIYSGTPLPQIKWTKKDGRMPDERVDYENYGKTLIIKFVDFEDAGTYECEATNGVGSAQSVSMTVDVQAIPYFTIEPEIQNKAEEETAVFECDASGKPQPKIQWIFNGKPIEQAQQRANREIHTNKIVITNLTKLDTGNYGCNATNEHGYSYKDVYVNVLSLAPQIKVAPTDERTVDGQTVNMTCRVFGAPKPRISWIKDDHELTGGRYSITDDGDLIISGVTFTDSGRYTCRAVNKLDSAAAVGSLEVLKRTKITDVPENFEVAAGSVATFRCNGNSDPSLELSIDWLVDGKLIDFEQQPRFILQSDNSLSITKTTELDSARYTCQASTDLDEVTAFAQLIVQDEPNAPEIKDVICNDKDARISWKAMGDNRAPILGYTIQQNTSFTPDTWEDKLFNFHPFSSEVTVELSPWANFSFRVIARNQIGRSPPSKPSKICTTPEDVPHKNPDGVQGKGSNPTNLVVKWSPMPEIDHNAPGFKYRIYWKREDIPGAAWESDEVVDWERDRYLVRDQPVFKPYRIKVEAHNERGQAQVTAAEVIGYSGEDIPRDAPYNLTLLEIKDATTAWLMWEPVSNESIRGHFKGYKIQTWTDEDGGETKARDIIVENKNEPSAVVNSFVPNMNNYVRVLVFNGAHDGPPSDFIELEMPEGTPGPVDSLEAVPLGSSGFLLLWQKPKRENGVLTGYHIYYQEVEGTDTGPLAERVPSITDADTTKAKLASLKPGTKYRITVKARTRAGIGSPFFIERTTRSAGADPPGEPSFMWQDLIRQNNEWAVKITWMPDQSNPGAHFFVQYKRYGESRMESTPHEINEDYIIIDGLDPSETYEMRIVAVDGSYQTPSPLQEVSTNLSDSPKSVFRPPNDSFATKGWFIGMMLAIAFLLLLLVIVCIVKRNRGGKYAVHEREAAHGRTDFNEDGAFPEYSQPLDGQKRDSLGSDVKHPVESDTDSMAEFAEGDTAGMAEDGSFIGKYGQSKGETSSTTAFATLV